MDSLQTYEICYPYEVPICISVAVANYDGQTTNKP